MSNFWKVIITVILTAAVVGGGGWYYMNKKATSDKAKLQSQIDDLNKQVAELKTSNSTPTTPDETADWKTYTNTTYGFSFKYPSDWRKEDSGEGLVQLYHTDPPEGAGRELNDSETKVVVYVKNQSDFNGDVDGYVAQSISEDNLSITSKENITVAGVISRKIVSPSVFGGKITLVFIPKSEKYIQFVWYDNTEKFNTLFSTFQFTK